MRLRIAAVLQLALAFLLACPAYAVDSIPAGLTFVASDGSTHSLAELHGHAAVVNFWATWCTPCRAEMPRLQKLADAYAARGVTFVAISLDDAGSQSRIPEAVRRSSFRIPVWRGATPETLKQLDLGILVPATLVLDEEGKVIGRIEGEARDRDIQSRLDWMLNGRAGKQPRVLQKNDW